jgi:hypothetical protein
MKTLEGDKMDGPSARLDLYGHPVDCHENGVEMEQRAWWIRDGQS